MDITRYRYLFPLHKDGSFGPRFHSPYITNVIKVFEFASRAVECRLVLSCRSSSLVQGHVSLASGGNARAFSDACSCCDNGMALCQIISLRVLAGSSLSSC